MNARRKFCCAHEYHKAQRCSREPPAKSANHMAKRRAINASMDNSSLLGIPVSTSCPFWVCDEFGDNESVFAVLT